MKTIFRAKIELLIHGRQHPTGIGYRPHVVVSGTEKLLGVSFLESMDFGPNDVIFKPLFPDVDYSMLQDGVEFTVREGQRIIGLGKILERVD